ncbi:hypothetical protein [Streptomyces ginkgonis]|uniref:hypothetical protein n=1 Tax=Streptomyces ginkgonis TaxID=1812259 RepID=UPI002176C66C|nr:hypothetical protein [Streptomyces ginkgonis]
MASLPVPAGVRTNDLVVSLCVQQSADADEPQLLAPAGVLSTRYTLRGSGIGLHTAVWPWDPHRGTRATWAAPGGGHTALANLVYRHASIEDLTLTPVDGVTEHSAVTEVPLPASENHTVLYAVLAVSSSLTGAVWPQEVTGRVQLLGEFGEHHISLMTADTPGGLPAPGALRLDATVDAACAVITIPGHTDGLPTWVLGDPDSSVLGETTYLG